MTEMRPTKPNLYHLDEGDLDELVRPEPSDVSGAAPLIARIDSILRDEIRPLLAAPGIDRTGDVEIPAAVLEGLRLVATAIAKGQAVTVAPHDLELTTQEAADMLHVSRPHLIKLLDRGDIPFHRTSDDPRAHRRVKLHDVVTYRQGRHTTRRSLLRDLTQASQDVEGGYR